MKIVQVSARYAISSDTLRYYERIGLIPPVNRNESGIRDYNESTVLKKSKRCSRLKVKFRKSSDKK
jgi:DNA-binding transcriptional MerR regulator